MSRLDMMRICGCACDVVQSMGMADFGGNVVRPVCWYINCVLVVRHGENTRVPFDVLW